MFHCAATVRFDEDLSKALTMNVSAVSFIISLCKRMKQLESLVHVSTAYCHCQRPHIEERSYPPPTQPRQALSLLESLDTKILDNPAFTKMLIGERPNTYTFTKALAEELIMSEARELPVCIVRPSIVLSTWRDPVPGWVDNLNGPTGLFLIAGGCWLELVLVALRLQMPRHRRDADSCDPRGPADGRGPGGHLRQPHHRRRLEHRQGVQVGIQQQQ